MSAHDAIRSVLDTVDYLRVTVGDEPADESAEWIACQPLVEDPRAVSDLVATTAAGRGTDRADVATSLFTQGYAFRIASIAIGTWYHDGTVIDIDPSITAVRLGRHRPNGVHLRDARTVASGDRAATLDALHTSLIDGHLAPFVATAHASCRIGAELLWSNVGAGCASAFGAFMGPLPDHHGQIRDSFEAFLAAARPEVARSGRIATVGTQWAWERAACCLWYKTTVGAGQKCADCSLWTDEERRARYADEVAAQEAGA